MSALNIATIVVSLTAIGITTWTALGPNRRIKRALKRIEEARRR